MQREQTVSCERVHPERGLKKKSHAPCGSTRILLGLPRAPAPPPPLLLRFGGGSGGDGIAIFCSSGAVTYTPCRLPSTAASLARPCPAMEAFRCTAWRPSRCSGRDNATPVALCVAAAPCRGFRCCRPQSRGRGGGGSSGETSRAARLDLGSGFGPRAWC